MSLRVTSSMMVSGTLRDLQSLLSKMQHTQTQLTTTKNLVRASDDPTAAATAMELRKQTNRADHYSRARTDAQGWLETADGALTSTLDQLNQVKTIAVRAASTGGLADPVARQGMASEIKSIRDDLLSLANTKYNGRSLFNGTAVGDAYDPSGSYLGNTSAVTRDVGPQLSIQVNTTGPSVFGTQGGSVGNLFNVLDRLQSAVQTGDSTQIAAEHANLDAATQQVSSATVDMGSRAARLTDIQNRAEDETLRLKTQLSTVEDVDVTKAIVTSQQQQASYQAALAVTAKILPPSLLDYMH
jgi:flagellar hook-associated protein 3 FlgL